MGQLDLDEYSNKYYTSNMDRESNIILSASPSDTTSRSCRSGGAPFMNKAINMLVVISLAYMLAQIIRWGLNGFRVVGL